MPPLSVCNDNSPVLGATPTVTVTATTLPSKVELTIPKDKTVKFCDSRTTIHEIPTVGIIEKTQIWMSKNDMLRIRKDCVKTLQRVMNQSIASQFSHEPLELRGLEAKLPYGVWKRQQCRKAAVQAVLNEQERQRKRHYSDPEWISTLYQQVTRRCEMEAKVIGDRDEFAVKRIASETAAAETGDASSSSTLRARKIMESPSSEGNESTPRSATPTTQSAMSSSPITSAKRAASANSTLLSLFPTRLEI